MNKQKVIIKLKKTCERLGIKEPNDWNIDEVELLNKEINKQMERRKEICEHCYDGLILPEVVCRCEVKKYNLNF